MPCKSFGRFDRVARAALLVTSLAVAACGPGAGAEGPDGGGGGPEEPIPSLILGLRSPMDGDLVEPGESVEIVLDVGMAGVVPSLAVNGQAVQINWTPDNVEPAVLRGRYTVPQGAAAPLRFVATAPDALAATATLQLPAPAKKASGTTAAGDTVITLPMGATLTIPRGTLPMGTSITFSAYDAAVIPSLQAVDLFSPVFRIHLGADETAIAGSMLLEQPISAADAKLLATDTARKLSLEVWEGEDPDAEAAPPSVRARLLINKDGTGTIRAEVPPEAFHHTGSSGTILALEGKKYPFRISQTEICGSDDSDNTVQHCTSMSDKISAPAEVTISCAEGTSTATSHVTVKATVAWSDPPPAFVSPLDAAAANGGMPGPPYTTSVFNPLRQRPYIMPAQFRPHKGNDLRAQKPWPLYAVAAGEARAHMAKEFTVDLAVGNWTIRSLHMSDFTGFSRKLKKDEVLGIDKDGADVKAPVDGTYSLACQESPAPPYNGPVPQAIMVCGVSRTDGTSPAIKKLYKLYDGTWTRMVAQGDQIGMTGHTSASGKYPYHLHMEVWYGAAGTGVPVDAALFYKTISDNKMVNSGDTSHLQTPTLRFAAQLSPGDPMNPAGGIPETILGVDPATLLDVTEAQALPPPIKCPYANGASLTKYRVAKVRGPSEMVNDLIDWDLGPCVYASVCDPNNPSDVAVTLGDTAWRYTESQESPARWNLLSKSGTFNMPPEKLVTAQVLDGLSAVVTVGGTSMTPTAADFEGMKVTVPALMGEFGAATMQVTKVTAVKLPWAGSFGGPEAGSPAPLSTSVPKNALLFSFGDNQQPAGVVGFPATFSPNNTANRNGRSNLIAAWQDNNKNWQWAFCISGGSYNSGGGLPQWHEYQFVYDSRKPAGQRMRYDVFLGANAMAGGWSFIRTAPLANGVTIGRKKTGYTLPGL